MARLGPPSKQRVTAIPDAPVQKSTLTGPVGVGVGSTAKAIRGVDKYVNKPEIETNNFYTRLMINMLLADVKRQLFRAIAPRTTYTRSCDANK